MKSLAKAFGVIFFSLFSLVGASAYGEVSLDGSMGPSGSVAGPDYEITADMGTQMNANLFHSFGVFNIETNETALFSGPDIVERIISRVTGGEPSFIDGTLATSIPGADLYLINPFGLVFGQNASLDVGGAFHASTADYLSLGQVGRFDARNPQQSILTTDPVSAFGFLTDDPAPVYLDGAQLAVQEGRDLSFSGGDLILQNGGLSASGGNLGLFSLSSSGEISALPENWDQIQGGGLISMTNAGLDASGERGGTVVIRGGRFVMDFSGVFANSGDMGGGRIDVGVTGSLEMTNGSAATADSYGSGGGSILVRAGSMVMEEDSWVGSIAYGNGDGAPIRFYVEEDLSITGLGSGIFTQTHGPGRSGDIEVEARTIRVDEGRIQAPTFSQGPAGDLTIRADGLYLTNGGQLGATSFESGQPGDIRVFCADTLSISGADPTFFFYSGIYTTTFGPMDGGDIYIDAPNLLMDNGLIASATEGSGDAGDIHINTETALISGGGQITTETQGSGAGGSLNLSASGSILMTGTDGFGAPSALLSQTYADGPGGEIHVDTPDLTLADEALVLADTYGPSQAGDVYLNVGSLHITGGAQISTSSRGAGNGGDIWVFADDIIEIYGFDESRTYRSGIYSMSLDQGDGGRIFLESDIFYLAYYGAVAMEARGLGDGGSLALTTRILEISNNGLVTAQTYGPGDAGTISLEMDTGEISTGGFVSASTSGSGSGGSIRVSASESLSIGNDPVDSQEDVSGLFSTSRSRDADAGRGGDIRVSARNLVLGENGAISAASAGPANAGDIGITSFDRVLLSGGSITTQADFAAGGNIQIMADGLILTNQSQITASVASGEGGGGNVTLEADAVVAVEDSDITARADQGFGGNILISAQAAVFGSESDLDASSNVEGREGQVSVVSPELDFAGVVTVLPENFLGADAMLPGRCADRVPDNKGGFVILRHGAFPPRVAGP